MSNEIDVMDLLPPPTPKFDLRLYDKLLGLSWALAYAQDYEFEEEYVTEFLSFQNVSLFEIADNWDLYMKKYEEENPGHIDPKNSNFAMVGKIIEEKAQAEAEDHAERMAERTWDDLGR